MPAGWTPFKERELRRILISPLGHTYTRWPFLSKKTKAKSRLSSWTRISDVHSNEATEPMWDSELLNRNMWHTCRIYPQAINVINNNRTYSVITTLHLSLPPCAYYIHHMNICFYPRIFCFGFLYILLLQYHLVILYLCYYHNAFCVSVNCFMWYTMVISWYMNFNTMVLVNVLLYCTLNHCAMVPRHIFMRLALYFSHVSSLFFTVCLVLVCLELFTSLPCQ